MQYMYIGKYANMYCTSASAVAEMGDRLATIDMGRKEGAAVPLSREGRSWVPIKHNVAWAEVYLRPPYQVAS